MWSIISEAFTWKFLWSFLGGLKVSCKVKHFLYGWQIDFLLPFLCLIWAYFGLRVPSCPFLPCTWFHSHRFPFNHKQTLNHLLLMPFTQKWLILPDFEGSHVWIDNSNNLHMITICMITLFFIAIFKYHIYFELFEKWINICCIKFLNLGIQVVCSF